ncbi:MAG: sensor histidine kinase [Williamsia sp.]|nr:sensor histidine kinase [Williamsia sp.]
MDSLSQQIIIIIVSSVFLLLVAGCIIVLVFVYQKRQIASIKEKEQLKADFEKQILESKLEMQEQTFKYVSQEIHDNIGQMLSLAKLTLNTMNPDEPSGLQHKITNTKNLVGKAVEDLRDLSQNLNTDHITDRGLQVSIAHALKVLENASQYTISIHADGEAYRLPQQQELILFRIFQEALQNILKHARSSAISVTLSYGPAQFVLRIADDGQGFDASLFKPGAATSAGIGLRNIRHRAKLIAADCVVESQPGKGTTVIICLPIQ